MMALAAVRPVHPVYPAEVGSMHRLLQAQRREEEVMTPPSRRLKTRGSGDDVWLEWLEVRTWLLALDSALGKRPQRRKQLLGSLQWFKGRRCRF